MAEPGTRRGWWRDFALILLPAAYTVGFLSWSIHQGTQGLGFHPLSVPQYLVVSVPILAVTVLGGLFRAALDEQFHVEPRSGFLRWLLLVVLDFIAFGLVAWIIFGLMSGIGILQPTKGATYASIVALVALILLSRGLSVFGELVNRIGRRFGLADASEPEYDPSKRRIRPSSKGPEPATLPFEEGWNEALLPTSMVFLVLLLLNGSIFIGEMAPEFGGGAPRSAHLDLDPSQVHEAWHTTLFNDTAAANATVARTLEVEVHLRTPDFILFRTADAPGNNDPLYDLSTSAVKGIVWLS